MDEAKSRVTVPAWFRRPLARWEYLITGVVLFAIKYPLDYALAHFVFDKDWSPMSYLSPRLGLIPTDEAILEMWAWLLVASLPFMVIGAALTYRRLGDAGVQPAWALLFFAPLINLPFIVVALSLPTKSERKDEVEASPFRQAQSEDAPPATGRSRPAFMATLWPKSLVARFVVGLLATLGITVGCVLGAHLSIHYVLLLFTVVPVLNGGIMGAAVTYGREHTTAGGVFGFVTMAMLFWATALVVTGAEGLGCLVMAVPAVIPMTYIGAFLGGLVGRNANTTVLVAGVVVAIMMPPASAIAGAFGTPLESHVETVVVVDAPADEVWKHVVAFPDIEQATTRWFFAFEYPVPMGAVIEGEGEGAVRRCIFDQGEFVEPVTIWEPGRHLAFDVASQPEAVPFWLEITRGEFILEDAPGGKTRLVGRTYYRAGISPEAYWTPWIEWGLHSVHHRVLDHIGALAESSAR